MLTNKQYYYYYYSRLMWRFTARKPVMARAGKFRPINRLLVDNDTVLTSVRRSSSVHSVDAGRCCALHQSSCNYRSTGQTDRQTDRQTDIVPLHRRSPLEAWCGITAIPRDLDVTFINLSRLTTDSSVVVWVVRSLCCVCVWVFVR